MISRRRIFGLFGAAAAAPIVAKLPMPAEVSPAVPAAMFSAVSDELYGRGPMMSAIAMASYEELLGEIDRVEKLIHGPA